jgi:hypothetical protein
MPLPRIRRSSSAGGWTPSHRAIGARSSSNGRVSVVARLPYLRKRKLGLTVLTSRR